MINNNIKKILPLVNVYQNYFDDIKSLNSDIMYLMSKNNLNFFRGYEKFGPNDIKFQHGSRAYIHSTNNESIKYDTDDKIKEKYILEKLLNARYEALSDYIIKNKNDNFWQTPLIEINKFDDFYMRDLSLVVHEGQQTDTRDSIDWLGPHLDAFPATYEYGMQHIITTMIYLNDDYGKGEIAFHHPDFNVVVYKPKAGDIVIFPSSYPYYHSVQAPYKNDRAAFRSDYNLDVEVKKLNNHIKYSEVDKTLHTDENAIYIDGKNI